MNKRRPFHSLAFLILLIALLIGSFATSSSKAYSHRMENLQVPNKLNLLIMVKASKTSNGLINDKELNPKTKLEVMRESILSVLEQNPLPPSTNIGIMAFGHKYDRADYNLTCSATNSEMVLPFQLASANIDASEFMKIQGMGETPMTFALEEAAKNFPKPSPDTLNVILLIADGIDTCHSNPADEAKILSKNQQIVIYTISFRAGADELKAIALNGSGKSFNVPALNNDSQKASEELNEALRSAFEDILTRISTHVLQTNTPTNTPTTTSTATTTSTDTATTTPTPTETPAKTIPEATSTNPIPTEKSPSSPIGTFGIFALVAILTLGILGYGLWFWRSRTTTKISDQTTEAENLVKTDDRLEDFRQDIDKAYASTGMNKYIPLESLKKQLSSKYALEQFDELLIQTRRKYPNKIWIDKDSKGQTLVKINL